MMRESDGVKAEFEELMQGCDESPIERLRVFCSLAMRPQDWIDVEPLFDAVIGHQVNLVRDAARYQWIKENSEDGLPPFAETDSAWRDLDAAIDKAMEWEMGSNAEYAPEVLMSSQLPKDTNLETMTAAAEKVVDRWDSPNWIRGEPHTGELILNLRKACDAVKKNAR